MLCKIHKLPLTPFMDASCFTMVAQVPVSAKVLTLQLQGGVPTIWYQFPYTKVDSTEHRKYHLVLTGKAFDDRGWTYVGT